LGSCSSFFPHRFARCLCSRQQIDLVARTFEQLRKLLRVRFRKLQTAEGWFISVCSYLLTPTKNAYRFGAASWAAMLRMASDCTGDRKPSATNCLRISMATSFRKRWTCDGNIRGALSHLVRLVDSFHAMLAEIPKILAIFENFLAIFSKEVSVSASLVC